MKKVFKKYFFELWMKYCLTVFSVLSFTLIFIPNDSFCVKCIIAGVIGLLLIVSYFGICFYESKKKNAKLIINNTEVNVFFGDIFEMEGKKVIAFNEYFDTQVDDIIIAKKSLNGQVISKGLIDATKFDDLISKNIELQPIGKPVKRYAGKTQKYRIGQIQPYNDFFALAFTHFNNDNEANLFSNEYANCLLEMWRQLNKYYAQNVINIPLLGSGITRICDNAEVTNQELLEIMLQTLKISKMTFKFPSKINIVLYPGETNKEIKKYDLIRIKSMFRR